MHWFHGAIAESGSGDLPPVDWGAPAAADALALFAEMRREGRLQAVIAIIAVLASMLFPATAATPVNVAAYGELRGKHTYRPGGQSAVEMLRRAVDGDPSTCWSSRGLPEKTTYFQIVFARPVPIDAVEIDWGVPAAKDYDVRVNDGDGWRTLSEARGNAEGAARLPCPGPVKSVRIDVSASVKPPYVRIAEIRLPAAVARAELGELRPPPRRVAPPTTASPPVIDGVVGAAEWDGAARVSGFRAGLYDDGPAPERTEVLLLQDAENLYVAFKCSVTGKGRFARGYERRDDPVHLDDHVEIFFDTNRDRRSYYQILVNFLGALADQRTDRRGLSSFSADAEWDADVTARVQRRERGWDVELAIRWSSFSSPDPVDVAWGVNFARGHGKELGYSIWAPTYGYYIWFPDKWGEMTPLACDREALQIEASSSARTPLSADRVVHADAEFVTWIATCLEAVPRAPPSNLDRIPTLRSGARLEIDAVAGEAEAVQLVITPRRAASPVRVTLAATDFRGPAGTLPGEAIELDRVRFVRLFEQWVPDVLIPVDGPFVVPYRQGESENQAIRVTAHVPEDLPAGRYEGALKVLFENRETIDAPMVVRVRNARIRKGSRFRTGLFSFTHWRDVVSPGSESYGKLVESVFEDYARHRVSNGQPAPVRLDMRRIPTPPELEEFDRWARFWLDRGLALDCVLSTSYLDEKTAPEVLRFWNDYLKSKGWLETAYVRHVDESVKRIVADGELVRRHAPELRTQSTISSLHSVEELRTYEPYIDIWMFSGLWRAMERQDFRDFVARLRRQGKEVWSYIHGHVVLGAAPCAPRRFFWLAWGRELDGCGLWSTTYWALSGLHRVGEDYAVAQRYCGEAGMLFYPDRPQSRVYRSVRWEQVRDGLEDWELLRLTRERAGKLDSRDPLRESVRQLLAAPKLLPVDADCLAAAKKLAWLRGRLLDVAEAVNSADPPARLHVDDMESPRAAELWRIYAGKGSGPASLSRAAARSGVRSIRFSSAEGYKITRAAHEDWSRYGRVSVWVKAQALDDRKLPSIRMALNAYDGKRWFPSDAQVHHFSADPRAPLAQGRWNRLELDISRFPWRKHVRQLVLYGRDGLFFVDDLVLDAAPAVPGPGPVLHQGQGWTLRAVPAWVEVTRQSAPAVAWDAPVRLSAARGEGESFILVMTREQAGDAETIKAQVTDLEGEPGGVPASSASVRRMAFYQYRDEDGRPEGPAVADALLETAEATVSEAGNVPFRVRIRVPRDAPAGLYRGHVVVERDGQTFARVPLELQVWAYALPARTSFRTGLFALGVMGGEFSQYLDGFQPYEPLRAETDAFIERNVLRVLAANRIAHAGPTPRAVRDFTFQRDPAVKELRLSAVAGRFEKWARYWTERGLALNCWQPYAAQEAGRPAAKRVREAFLREWTPWLKERGWLRSVYYRLPDEMLGRPEQTRPLLQLCDELRGLSPEYPIQATFTQPEKSRELLKPFEGKIDILMMAASGHCLPEAAAYLEENWRARGAELWWYVHGVLERGAGPTLPAFFWRAWLHKIRGCGLFSLNTWRGTGLEVRGEDYSVLARSRYPGVVSLLFWPAASRDRLHPSVRLEAICDGIEEWERLRLLEKAASQSAGAKAALAEIVRELEPLRFARSLLPWEAAEAVPTTETLRRRASRALHENAR